MNELIGKTTSLSKIISEKDIKNFIEISGDNNPIHHNKQFAARTFFRKPIAHGLISASIISAGLTNLMGAGNLWLSQNLKFEKPVYVGDTISAFLKIISVDENEVFTIETIIKNQNRKIVISGVAKSKLLYIRKVKKKLV